MDREQRPARQNAANRRRKKVCVFCAEKVEKIDYKDVARLRKFVLNVPKFSPAA